MLVKQRERTYWWINLNCYFHQKEREKNIFENKKYPPKILLVYEREHTGYVDEPKLLPTSEKETYCWSKKKTTVAMKDYNEIFEESEVVKGTND